MHKDTLALYSGRLTLANGAFLLLYTAWLQWTARIVAPRHFLRLHTASLWIAPVVGEDTFSPSSARVLRPPHLAARRRSTCVAALPCSPTALKAIPDSQTLHPENLAFPTPVPYTHAAGIFFSPVLFQGFLAYIAYKGVEEYRVILHQLYHAAYFPPPVTAGAQPTAPGERSLLPARSTTSVPLSLGDGHQGMPGAGEASATRTNDTAGKRDMALPPWAAGLHCTCAFLLAAWYSAC